MTTARHAEVELALLLRSAWLWSCVLYLTPSKGGAGCGCSLLMASQPLCLVNMTLDKFSEPSRGMVTLPALENPGHEELGKGRGDLPEKLLS